MPRDKLMDLTRTYLPTGAVVTLLVVTVGFFTSVQREIRDYREEQRMQHQALIHEIDGVRQSVEAWVAGLEKANPELRTPALTQPPRRGG